MPARDPASSLLTGFRPLHPLDKLLRSPKNAKRLLEAIVRAVQGDATAIDPAALRRSLKLTESK
ncbi:MAG: hypothetical protein ABIZ91_12925 [Gemmatimonadaceae bacterium]